MSYELALGEDRTLRFTMLGDLDNVAAAQFGREYQLYLAASTPSNPIMMIVDAEQMGRVSSQTRKMFMQMNDDPRLGLVAIVNPPRTLRVLSQFILKATGRNNIAFFENEEDASAWIRATARQGAPQQG